MIAVTLSVFQATVELRTSQVLRRTLGVSRKVTGVPRPLPPSALICKSKAGRYGDMSDEPTADVLFATCLRSSGSAVLPVGRLALRAAID
jgi:hypothetical protein